jgi:hypothetical protein
MRQFMSTAALCFSLLLMLLALSAGTTAQIPDKFTNLQVLPKEISKADLVSLMRNYAGDLNVRCGFCHTGGDPNTLQALILLPMKMIRKRLRAL